jgi:hypothetical protein
MGFSSHRFYPPAWANALFPGLARELLISPGMDDRHSSIQFLVQKSEQLIEASRKLIAELAARLAHRQVDSERSGQRENQSHA